MRRPGKVNEQYAKVLRKFRDQPVDDDRFTVVDVGKLIDARWLGDLVEFSLPTYITV